MTKDEAIKYLQQIYSDGGYCWLNEQRIEAIGMAIQALQEEPASDDLEESALLYLSKHYDTSVIWDEDKNCVLRDFKAGAKWQKEQDIKHGYVTFLQGEKRFANYILEMINNGWHITAIKTACNDKIKEE